MDAALVYSFDSFPRFGQIERPGPIQGEVLIDVAAAALTPLVRSKANGSHYSSVAEFPFIPGNDGVGVLPNGQRVYFLTSRSAYGSMAEQTVAHEDSVIPLPDDLENVSAAAIANPGMSSWAALSSRAKLVPGETVLIHGATGSAGRIAVQIAKLMGAGRVIAAGRNETVLESLRSIGADETISLARPEDEVARDFKAKIQAGAVDVILDYLWGAPAERLLSAFVSHGRQEGEPRVRFVQIGTSAGPSVALTGATLRSSGLELMGSGFGSVSHADLLAGIAALFRSANQAGIDVDMEVVPLTAVEDAWGRQTQDRRIVFTI